MTNVRYTVVPPGESKCVWMTAGILSYQLCDRAFECDDCPLDKAMRNRMAPPGPAAAAAPAPPAAESRALRADFLYSDGHCWVERKHDDIVRVGIEPGLAGVLLIPRAVVLPPIGQQLRRGQVCVWVVMDEGTFPIMSPAEGEVVARNTRVSDEPRLLSLHPSDEGWLFHLRLGEERLEDAGLFTVAEAAGRFAGDAARLKDVLLGEAHRTPPPVGATLADGGLPLQSIADTIGAKNYFAAVRKIYAP